MKRPAMDFTHSDFLKNPAVFGRAVTLVVLKIVPGKLAVIHFHDPVP
jgi:hypothetical protein